MWLSSALASLLPASLAGPCASPPTAPPHLPHRLPASRFLLLCPPACPPLPARHCLQFCHRLTREAGVTLIPVSAFYADRASAPRTLVRFVFCKTDQKLHTACDKLRRYLGQE